MPEQTGTGRRRRGGSVWLGLGIDVAAFLAAWATSVAVPYDNPMSKYLELALGLWVFALLATGVSLCAFEQTRRTGAGILVGIGAAILIYAGICFTYFG
ncbi:MAG TPA: hypothetical protein VGK18_02560 [Propionicimonas sp.]|jgi:NO-binding membrane sensor protein with MHYT domain|uniref:hypothetical protein n=1 Tax=Propionicimonas sp. TaxID=1955623 RepID=UPI002F40317E